MRDYFTGLRGNDAAKKRIGQAIESGTLPHAFLIDGEDGSGKMTLALEIAAALNCENVSDASMPRPCGACNNCRKIKEGGFVDVKVLKRADDKASIGVSEIKNFRADMYLSTTESEYKVYVIDEAERMTVEAQNALLIVLEEPPKNVVIMLLASGTDRILSTIKSRTQYCAMSRFTKEELLDILKGDARARMTGEKELTEIAVASDGRIGKAFELLSPSASTDEKEKRELVLSFLKASKRRTPYSEIYKAVKAFPTKRNELLDIFERVMTALRDLILLNKDENAKTCFFANENEANELAESINLRRLVKIYDVINLAHADCSKNTNTNTLLANLCAKIKLL